MNESLENAFPVTNHDIPSLQAFPNYYFNYDVHDSKEDGLDSRGQRKRGANFGHSERREGSRTEGRYYVELPDGRTQVVEYYADETGYHPTITYI